MATSASTSFASTSTIAVPTNTSRCSNQTDPLDPSLSFGYTLSAGNESRHDAARRDSFATEVLPAYDEGSGIPLPKYTVTATAPEPLTLAMYLFKFGFLFPPFWIFGVLILLSPLREPATTADADTPTWMAEKTEEERQAIIASMREVELKWACRCLCALVIFTSLVAGGAVVAWGVLRH